MIYTEIESHTASLRERWQVLRLVWTCTRGCDVPRIARWQVRRRAVRLYVLSRRPQVSYYLINRR